MLNFRWGISILLGLTLVGCWNPTKSAKTGTDQGQNGNDGSANFLLRFADGDGNPTGEKTNNLGLATSRHYHFYACLLNRANPQPIRGIYFRISSATSSAEIPTDNDGCLHWYERTSFDPLGEEAYVQLERTIEGIGGVYRGTRKVVFAVDPWRDGRQTPGINKEVKWIRDDQQTDLPFNLRTVEKGVVQSVLIGTLPSINPQDLNSQGGRKKKAKRLWMTSVHSQIKELREDGLGSEIEVMLNMYPAVIYHDLNGLPNPVPLKKGSFRVDAQLVASNVGIDRDEDLILTPELPPTVTSISEGDGILKSSVKVVLSRRVPRGNLRLALKVSPIVSSPEEVGLEDFEGLYELGPPSKMEGKLTSLFPARAFSQGDSFKYEEFLGKTSNFDKLKAARMAFDNEPFEYPNMNIKFETIRPGETATTRTVEFSITSCVQNPRTSEVKKDELFYVDFIPDEKSKKLEESFYVDEPLEDKPWCDLEGKPPAGVTSCREIYKTDEKGCLHVMGRVTHKFYNSEELLFPSIELTPVSLKSSKTYKKKVLKMAINPWDLFATFGRDYRELTPDYLESIQKREKIPSLLFVPEFSYHTLRFRYEIDEFMNLVVKKVLLLKMQPMVMRYHSITDGRRAINSLRDGIYLLKIAAERSYLDPAAKGVVIGFDHSEQKTKYLELPRETRTKEYLYAEKKLVRVQDGIIMTPIEVAVRDLRILRVRSNFLIQLETVDEKKLTIVNTVHEELKALAEGRQKEVKSIEKEVNYYHQLYDDLRGRPDIEDPQQWVEQMMEPLRKSLRENHDLSVKKSIDDTFDKMGKKEVNVPMPADLNLGSLPDIYRPADSEKSGYLRPFDYMGELPNQFFSRVKDKALAAYKKNDVTYISIAPIVPLNSLTDLRSGLNARTFIGPVTLLLNSNSSYVRPLDNPEEGYCKETDDCREVIAHNGDLKDKLEGKKSVKEEEKSEKEKQKDKEKKEKQKEKEERYQNSPLFGSIRDMIEDNAQLMKRIKEERETGEIHTEEKGYVDILIGKMIKLENEYLARNSVLRLLYSYVTMEGLKFVSLQDEVLKKFNTSKCSSVDQYIHDGAQCLDDAPEVSIKMKDVIDQLNCPISDSGYCLIKRGIEKSDIEDLISTGKLSERLGYSFCDLLAAKAKAVWKTYDPRGTTPMNDALRDLSSICKGRLYVSGPTMIAHIPFGGNSFSGLYVERLARVLETGSYRFMGGKPLNINVGASFASSYTSTFAGGWSYNILPEVISKEIPFLRSIVSLFALKEERSRSNTNGVMINEGAYLAMQEATMHVELIDYEKCVVVKLNPALLETRLMRVFAWFDKTRSFDEKQAPLIMEQLTPGFLFCDGKKANGEDREIFPIREKYYYYSQHFTEGDLLDASDLYNHPWLLALRGKMKFQEFVSIIKALPFSQDLQPLVKEEGWSLDYMMGSYLKIHSAFPGLHTIIDEDFAAQYPSQERPSESFQNGSSHKSSEGATDEGKSRKSSEAESSSSGSAATTDGLRPTEDGGK